MTSPNGGAQIYLSQVFPTEHLAEFCLNPFGIWLGKSSVPSIHEVELDRYYVTLTARGNLMVQLTKRLKNNKSLISPSINLCLPLALSIATESRPSQDPIWRQHSRQG